MKPQEVHLLAKIWVVDSYYNGPCTIMYWKKEG